jgi:hypothetical protein
MHQQAGAVPFPGMEGSADVLPWNSDAKTRTAPRCGGPLRSEANGESSSSKMAGGSQSSSTPKPRRSAPRRSWSDCGTSGIKDAWATCLTSGRKTRCAWAPASPRACGMRWTGSVTFWGLRSTRTSPRRAAALYERATLTPAADGDGQHLWVTHGKTAHARRPLEVPELLRPFLRRLAQGKQPTELLFGVGSNGNARRVSAALGLDLNRSRIDPKARKPVFPDED